jgi:serine/threonine protein kinase
MFFFLLFVYRMWRQRCCTSANAEFFFPPSSAYVAPEVLNQRKKKSGYHSEVDLWSLGMRSFFFFFPETQAYAWTH